MIIAFLTSITLLPALLTVPMILFILPTLFIVLLGPAALGIIDTFAHR